MNDKEKAFNVLIKLLSTDVYESAAGNKILEVNIPKTALFGKRSFIVCLEKEDYEILKHALTETYK